MSQIATLEKETVPSIDASNARALWFQGNWMRVHKDSADTNGQFALVEAVMRPGSEPPLHIHEREDETFVVLEGQIQVVCGGREYVLRAGDSLFAPRMVPHTFRILTPVARTFNIITPGGFEDFFRALGQPAEGSYIPERPPQLPFERIQEVSARFGVRLA